MKTRQNNLKVSFFILLINCCHLLIRSENVEDYSSYSYRVRPNIIVIIADDLGWNDVSFNGADQIPTPNIDALAYNGVILNKHYVLPTCTPSRTAFLTGYHPIRQGMEGVPLKAGEKRAIPKRYKLLPEYLKDLGYSTHLVGKWHVGYYAPRYTPTRRGFNTYFGYYNGYIQYFNHTTPEIKSNMHLGHDLHRDKPNKLSPDFSTGYMTDLITEEAEKIISNHDPATPLYLQIAHLAMHASGLDNGEELQVKDMKKVNDTFGYIKDINRRKLAGVINSLDQSVGRVVDALSKADLLNNSIILYFSDNGAQTIGMLQNHGSNYPLRGLKFTTYEGGVRSASCIYSPLIKKPSTISNQLIHITDWLPTLYSAAGGNLNNLKNFDGIDQWNTIKKGRRSKRNSILLNIDNKIKDEAAIIGNYKLLKNSNYYNYDGYFGDNGTDSSYPKYKTLDVISSLAGRAISTVAKKKLTSEKIHELRQSTKVTCKHPNNLMDCTDHCLFDLSTDPCETTDISKYYPKITVHLRNYIDVYRKVVVNQTYNGVDPRSYPEHFNGTWMPWISDDLDDLEMNYKKEFLKINLSV
ncbi:PREDICTED: arylsulfatase B-like [Polistes dominula]|uniref:Arylsulfatase B-like n=1 Tax=Polistes dominula TaxID=743375 RepID=A0ABM1IQC8_POLDO|nr:PREDICTED: arylsulfatase B-like [Polistes dominula]